MNKKNMSIVISIIIILLIFAAILILKNINDNQSKPNNFDHDVVDNENIKLSVLNDDSDYFNVQNIINTYYMKLTNRKIANVYDMLDFDYIQKNNITKDNLTTKIDNNHGDVSFTAKKIYYLNKNNRHYYFVNGYIIEQYVDGSFDYNKNINFFVTVDHNLFSIYPLNNSNYNDFVNSYNFEEKALFSRYNTIKVDTSKKLSTYIANFLYLLNINSQDAYDYLDDDAKRKYKTPNDMKIGAKKLTSVVFSYEYDELSSSYKVLDNKLNEIIIKENGIMNYKISF